MAIDLAELATLFRFSVSPVELVLRGSVMYWFLFLLFRFLLRRDVASLGLADVLLLVLIADAAENAMAGGYDSLVDGCLLVSTIAAWNYGLDWASYRYVALRRFVEPPKLALVKNGKVVLSNLRRQMLTVEDLRAKLRQHGIESIGDVKRAYMEPDGKISAVRFDPP
jgi:uncharacterized membrane protein YcaP (DUF421 family)